MKNLQILSLIAILFVAWSCDTEEPPEDGVGTLSLKIEAEFDGNPLLSDQDFTLPDGKKARIKQLNFFISDIVVDLLEIGTATITDLSEVEFVELTQTSTTPLEPTDNTFQYFQLPEGDYDALAFTLGLAETLNNKTPSDQDLGDGSPLRKSSHHWSAWGSYIFMKLEGTIDFNEDGILGEDENIVYHTGSDNDGEGEDRTAHQVMTFPVGFTIVKDQTSEVVFTLDVSEILYNDMGEPKWDIENRRTTHNPDDFNLVEEVMVSAANSFKIGD